MWSTCDEILDGGNQQLPVPRSYQIRLGLQHYTIITSSQTSHICNSIKPRPPSHTHPHENERLGLGLLGLREVKVHLVSVEISVVGRAHTLVEPESPVWHHLSLRGSQEVARDHERSPLPMERGGPTHKVGHDAQLVERWLTVEEDDIAVYEVSLHQVSVLFHGMGMGMGMGMCPHTEQQVLLLQTHLQLFSRLLTVSILEKPGREIQIKNLTPTPSPL